MGLRRGRVSSSRQVRTPPRWGRARAGLGVGVPGRPLGKGRGGGGGVKLAAPLPKPLRKLDASGLGRGSFLPPGAPINLGAGLRLAARRLPPPDVGSLDEKMKSLDVNQDSELKFTEYWRLIGELAKELRKEKALEIRKK
ncbi:protein S100-A13 isoform X1 [Manis pentadactyla]|uniref:protein S100-A13 isoform X1 n=1 Tax=Manis pentadactyla TaxID=143292 RepID=UPI00255C659F|nr:protein S100-A13 isoform X1 [Manis pentadactyla]